MEGFFQIEIIINVLAGFFNFYGHYHDYKFSDTFSARTDFRQTLTSIVGSRAERVYNVLNNYDDAL